MNRAFKVVPLALLLAGVLVWTPGGRVTAGAQTPAASVPLLSLGTASLSGDASNSDGFVRLDE